MITIIVGSTRGNAQSLKVGHYLQKALQKSHGCKNVNLLDLFALNLPLWTEDNHKTNKDWPAASEQLKKSSAFVVITPEWDGMACPGLKNFFNYCHSRELFHKPALLVGVSAGRGGSYPIAELRMSSYKNSRVCYLPEHVIIRQVEAVLNQDIPVGDDDNHIRTRIEFALKTLLCYEKAFKEISHQEFLQDKAYSSGM